MRAHSRPERCQHGSLQCSLYRTLAVKRFTWTSQRLCAYKDLETRRHCSSEDMLDSQLCEGGQFKLLEARRRCDIEQGNVTR